MQEGEYLNKPIEDIPISKPKPTSTITKTDRIGSKTAPIEYQMDFDLMEYGDEQFEEYIHSYNYYIYYLSIKPRDPRLPKPLYKPTADLDFIKSGVFSEKSEETEWSRDSTHKQNNFSMYSERIINTKDNECNEMADRKDSNNKNNQQKYNYDSEQFDYYGNDRLTPYSENFSKYNNLSESAQRSGNDCRATSNANPDTNSNLSMTNNYLSLIINNFDKNLQLCEQISNADKPQNPQTFNQEYNQYAYKFPINNYNTHLQGAYENQGTSNEFEDNLQLHSPYSFANPYQNYYQINKGSSAHNNQFNQDVEQKIPYKHSAKQYESDNFNQNAKNSNYKSNAHHKFKKQDQNQLNNIVISQDLSQIIRNIIEYSKDHSGSRMIQKRFEEGSDSDKSNLMEAIIPHAYKLSKDVFGNYVIQKFLEYSLRSHTTKQILRNLEGKIDELTFHMYGCRVLQKSIEIAEIEDVKKIFYEIRHQILKYVEDQNGNHVIQKLIDRLPENENKEIIKIIKDKVLQIVTHQYGCRVIQKILDKNKLEDCQVIIRQIFKSAYQLSQNQYGNYAIQYIIEKQNSENILNIFGELKDNIFDLSLHKYASNVIEKMLEYGNTLVRTNIIEKIIQKDDQFSDSLLAMVRDKYGNYVVQKLIEVADFKTKENIVRRIINSQSLKKRDGFSKHVISFIEKMGFNFPQANHKS